MKLMLFCGENIAVHQYARFVICHDSDKKY